MKRFFKLFLIVVMTFVLAFSFIACNNDPPPDDDGGSGPGIETGTGSETGSGTGTGSGSGTGTGSGSTPQAVVPEANKLVGLWTGFSGYVNVNLSVYANGTYVYLETSNGSSRRRSGNWIYADKDFYMITSTGYYQMQHSGNTMYLHTAAGAFFLTKQAHVVATENVAGKWKLVSVKSNSNTLTPEQYSQSTGHKVDVNIEVNSDYSFGIATTAGNVTTHKYGFWSYNSSNSTLIASMIASDGPDTVYSIINNQMVIDMGGGKYYYLEKDTSTTDSTPDNTPPAGYYRVSKLVSDQWTLTGPSVDSHLGGSRAFKINSDGTCLEIIISTAKKTEQLRYYTLADNVFNVYYDQQKTNLIDEYNYSSNQLTKTVSGTTYTYTKDYCLVTGALDTPPSTPDTDDSEPGTPPAVLETSDPDFAALVEGVWSFEGVRWYGSAFINGYNIKVATLIFDNDGTATFQYVNETPSGMKPVTSSGVWIAKDKKVKIFKDATQAKLLHEFVYDKGFLSTDVKNADYTGTLKLAEMPFYPFDNNCLVLDKASLVGQWKLVGVISNGTTGTVYSLANLQENAGMTVDMIIKLFDDFTYESVELAGPVKSTTRSSWNYSYSQGTLQDPAANSVIAFNMYQHQYSGEKYLCVLIDGAGYYFERYSFDVNFDFLQDKGEYTPVTSPVIGEYDLTKVIFGNTVYEGSQLEAELDGVEMTFEFKDDGTCVFVTAEQSQEIEVTYYWSYNNGVINLYADEQKTTLGMQLTFENDVVTMVDAQTNGQYFFSKAQSN
ncbi:MAG: hypothetical protein IJV77_05810 [Clostridia bacterium]|nr:hypothetical protein [Clostridia bacterium]